MAFDITAAHVIFFVAFLGVGSAAIGAFWNASSELDEGRRLEQERLSEQVHTNLTVLNASYDAGAQRFTVNIKNVGSTVLDLTRFVYLVDGVYVESGSIESVSVRNVTGSTDLLIPMDVVEVRFLPIATSPTSFKVAADNAVSAYWRA